MYLIIVAVYYHSPVTNFTEIFLAFEDGLSKPAVATMAEGSISTSDLRSYVLDGLFDSLGKETILEDDDIKNYADVDELIFHFLILGCE